MPDTRALLAILLQVASSLEKIAESLSALQGTHQGSVAPTAVPLPLPSAPAPADQVLLADAVNALLEAKARIGRSDRYLRALHSTLSTFSRGRSTRAIASITTDEIEAFLERPEWSSRTRANYVDGLHLLWNWCRRRGWIQGNPVAAIELEAHPAKPPALHSPEDVRRVLEAARSKSLAVMRHLAIRYFAGLRTAEALRLEESDIGERYIEVKAAKSKTRQRRLIRIQPNLRAWLELGGTLPMEDPKRITDLHRLAGVAWPANVTRHTWCSYHLAHFGSASRTALEAGHSESMLFAHYRELATPEAAAAFWEIRPASAPGERDPQPAPLPQDSQQGPSRPGTPPA